MELLIGIALIASAILNIILFFKIWGMTNNVSEMKDVISDISAMQEEQAKKKGDTIPSDCELYTLIMSDKNNADNLLRSILMNEYIGIVEPIKGKIISNTKVKYDGQSMELNDYVECKFAPIKEKYTKFYEAIGLNFPEDIARLNADSYKIILL